MYMYILIYQRYTITYMPEKIEAALMEHIVCCGLGAAACVLIKQQQISTQAKSIACF